MAAITAQGEAERARRDRLLWQCRRGMLELDLLLRGFVERHYDALNERQLELFLALLKEPDQTLQGYLFGQDQPRDGEMADVVRWIRSSALS